MNAKCGSAPAGSARELEGAEDRVLNPDQEDVVHPLCEREHLGDVRTRSLFVPELSVDVREDRQRPSPIDLLPGHLCELESLTRVFLRDTQVPGVGFGECQMHTNVR